MKYVVLKDFLDRFDNRRHCKPGEIHIPPNEERAKRLVELGFIRPVEETKSRVKEVEQEVLEHEDGVGENQDEGIKHVGGGYWQLPNGEKIRGKEKALKALAEMNVGEGGDPDGGQADESAEV